VERDRSGVSTRHAGIVLPVFAGIGMSYSAITDFIGLLRSTGGGIRSVRMPGLDYLIAGLARAELFLLWTGTTAPTSNQATTVWLLPASPSTVAEGAIFLWNGSAYVPATPALWSVLFAGGQSSGYVFQEVTTGAGAVNSATSLLAVERVNPAATALTLPSVSVRGGEALQVVDWSSAVANHAITLTPNGAETIMRLSSFELLSTPDQLAGVTLYPSVDLNGWVIAS
jgi:hypothetical protein